MKKISWFAWVFSILIAFHATNVFSCEIEGCTPGYWKNHLYAWIVYSPDQSVDSVFEVPGDFQELADDTLLEALNYGGGDGLVGAAQIMLRQAIATLLNAVHADVRTPYSEEFVIYHVSRGLNSYDRERMIWIAAKAETLNEMGCPLD
ncbi:MAG: hypothetical protein U9Q81_09590 [Pseudomonadota bacterium]|nr:hypothetical protein [Pseudomonadota bacterium]